MAKKKADPNELREAREASRQFRQMIAQRRARLAAWDEAQERRKARLRRWSLGVLGR